MTEQVQNSKRHIVARDFLIPLIVGIVGVAGSLGGVLIANSNSAQLAERQKLIEFETKIFEQRLSLIDRAAKIFGKSPGLQDVWTQYTNRISSTKGKSPTLPAQLVEKLTEAQGEFQSVVFLAQVYFGPNTRAAITDMSSIEGPWWKKPKAKQDALIAAMLSEASVGLTAIPSLGKHAQ